MDRWYDVEKGVFIHDSEFQPEQNLAHAMLIVERLRGVWVYIYHKWGIKVVFFNNVRATGDTLSQAITNAAYSIIENNSIVASSRVWQRLC